MTRRVKWATWQIRKTELGLNVEAIGEHDECTSQADHTGSLSRSGSGSQKLASNPTA
jgi:ABC-type uncharacterized transport system permease subunit